MTPYERHQAVLTGQDPDNIDVVAAIGLRNGPMGGWARRLSQRGMGLTHIVAPYKPLFFFDTIVNPFIKEVRYTQTTFIEQHVWKTIHIFTTEKGEIQSIVNKNPGLDLVTGHVCEPFIKTEKDWDVVNYMFQKMYEALTPNYEEMSRDQEDLGEHGTTIGVIDRTPFQRLWLEFSTIEETSYAVYDEEPYFLEFIDIQQKFHQKAALIAAESPAYHFQLIDNITNTISPDLYKTYCMPIYDVYTKAFQGTGKKLAVHCDGLLSHIHEEIKDSSFDIIDSFTAPPVGDVSLTDAKKFWPNKIIAMNLAPHLAHSTYDEIVKEYEHLIAEWGSKRLIIEHVEDMPQETLEMHLSAVLDVCGYPS